MDLIKLNAFPSVAANARSTLVTDELIDKSLKGLLFEQDGTAFDKSHIDNIRVRVDGKDIVNGITGAQLTDLNEYEGLTDVTNYFYLPFGDPTAKTFKGQHLGDIDFSLYRKPIEIEITIGAATAPTLAVYADVSPISKLAMGVGYTSVEAASFRALIRSILSPTAAVSRQTYGVSIGSAAGGRIRRLALFHSNLASVELKKGSFTKWDDIAIAANNAVAQQFARVPQTGLYVLDRIVDQNQGESEPTVRDDGRPWNLQLALTTSAADTITAFADMFITHPAL